mmetsp:Transcript_19808/g.40241  ORF Transcript_19808/g.40241 Transcript_19808/m.40241 type:complete len:491 (-) Transcript_19808:277-1749(-)
MAKGEEMEGYLLKKNRIGVWSWRWVVLDRTTNPPTLCLYMKRMSRKPKETIPINASTSVSLVNQLSSRRHFTISTVSPDDGRRHRWSFCAGSKESLLVWREKLDSTVDAVSDMLHQKAEVIDISSHDSFGLGSISGGKYHAIKQVGEGSYGSVISAYDKYGRTKVAVKTIHGVFDNLVDAKRIVREITALRCLNHDNVIRLVDLLVPPAPQNVNDIYIVTELMDQDLYSVIYHREKLSLSHVQLILYQILCALKYIHSAGVLHRDLKPQNILISSDCKVKLCDFGLARCLTSRAADDSRDKKLTQYIVTRWYRAPEILLRCETYTEAVDVWGLGCIVGEMLQQSPLFPGSDYISQIRLILDFVGRPEEHDGLEFITNARAKRFVRSVTLSTPVVDSNEFFPEEDGSIRYLLLRMLALDPSERISVDTILSDNFFASIRDIGMEKVAPRRLIWDKIDNVDLTKDNLQALVYKEAGALMESRRERLARRNSY